MTVMTRRTALTLFGGLTVGASAGAAFAQSAEQFYKGRQVTMVVGTAPGGSITPTNGVTSQPPSRHVNNRL